MSDIVQGIVARISSKSAGRSGDKVYNICMEIDGQDDEWFGHGFDKPEFQEGDEIEFEISYNGEYANVNVSSVVFIAEAAHSNSRSNTRSNGRSGSSNGGTKRSASRSSGSSHKPSRKSNTASDDKMTKAEWAQKDTIIQLQACMNTAIALVVGGIRCDAVKLPTAMNKRWDAYAALCNEEAERLHSQYVEEVYGKATGGGRSHHNIYDDDVPQ